MFEKRLNKKGQEGLTLTTLLLIVLGIVVVVVIILGATGIFGDIFGKREAFPKALEAVTQSCKLAAQVSLIADYCYEFKKISDNEYINCEDPRVQSSLSEQGIIVGFSCEPSLTKDAKKGVCLDFSAAKQKEVRVGGRFCSDIIGNVKCDDIAIEVPNDNPKTDSQWRVQGACIKLGPSDLNKYDDVTYLVTDFTGRSNENDVCCKVTEL
ncbi:MAG: hypothetical protein IIA87_00475 [Nanoarchaeota archaeon]|nr:hypothetical protein [Nanoarchaeota archaeon]